MLKTVVDNDLKPETIKHGFRACGLLPWDASAINYSKCVAKDKQKPNQEIQTERRDSITFTQFQTIVGKEQTELDQFNIDAVYNEDFVTLHQLYKEFSQTEDKDEEIIRPEVLFTKDGKGSNEFESDFTNGIEDISNLNIENIPILTE